MRKTSLTRQVEFFAACGRVVGVRSIGTCSLRFFDTLVLCSWVRLTEAGCEQGTTLRRTKNEELRTKNEFLITGGAGAEGYRGERPAVCCFAGLETHVRLRPGLCHWPCSRGAVLF